MRLNIKAIVVGILSLSVFSSLVMLFSGNTPHSILSPSLKLVPPLLFLLISHCLCFLMILLQSLLQFFLYLLLILRFFLSHLHWLWILSLIRLLSFLLLPFLTFLLLLLLLTLRFLPKNLHHPWILSLIRLLPSPLPL